MAISALALQNGSWISVSSPVSAVSPAFAAGQDILEVRLPTFASQVPMSDLAGPKAVSGGRGYL